MSKGYIGDAIRNPAMLHERWSDLPDASLIGIFQYSQHATDLAKALALRETDDKRAWVVTDFYTGQQNAYVRSRVAAAEQGAAK